MKPPLRALAVALVVSLGFGAGFLSYRIQSTRPQPQPVPASAAAVEPPRSPASEAPPTPTLPAASVPSVLPDLSLPDLNGGLRRLRSFSGRPLIVNFWATWCAPCRREIPLLRELRQRHRAERLEIIGIAIDFQPAVQQYLEKTPIDYPLLVGEQGGLSAAAQFGVPNVVLPFSVFADAAGRIVAVKVGELHREEAEFILSEIQALQQGQTSMSQAREQIEARLRQLSIDRAKAQQNGE